EEVEWSVYKDVSEDKYLFLMSLAFTVFMFALVSLMTLPSLEFLPLQLFGSLFFIVSIYLYMSQGRKESWYFITTKRILETRGKQIVQEANRSVFGNTPLHDLISMRTKIFEGESGNTKHYEITVHDPETAEPLFEFTRLWFTDVEKYSLFQDMQECPSCGVKISSNIEKCLVCVHPLV
ncbi:MAG: hypothetical protein ACW98Y_16675, partial [Candidatus Thorarchaeota archaeon]